MRRRVHILALVVAVGGAAVATSATADYARVSDQSVFNQLVVGRDLTRMGITVRVTPSGEITGRAFGKPVNGSWTWRDGFFCRDLSWGDTEFGYNCQEVARNGDSIRFTSDRGSGRSASLTLN